MLIERLEHDQLNRDRQSLVAAKISSAMLAAALVSRLVFSAGYWQLLDQRCVAPVLHCVFVTL
jgi:hypothetical protein